MKINIKNLKKFRNYLISGKWKKVGGFDMSCIWNNYFNCGCVLGHAQRSDIFGITPEVGKISSTLFSIHGGTLHSNLWEFLFSSFWYDYDNTVEGAVGRIDAVIDGLRFQKGGIMGKKKKQKQKQRKQAQKQNVKKKN